MNSDSSSLDIDEKSFDSASSPLTSSNIIGTHPAEVKTSVNPDNGYPVRQENGQRKTGPPPDWPTTRHPPGRGCEVFVGKLPRDCFEAELFPLFERCGQIYEMRLMLDFSGYNRGYTFITFTNRDDAKRCVKELNNYEIRPNHSIGVCQSVDNCRLFVGGIPKTKKRDEILDQMCQITEGVVDVIVYPSTNDKTKNRGFAFVEYESHRSAAMARRKLLPGNIQLWGQQIAVDWAEPENQVDEDVMANVRILYVRNLMMHTTEEKIREVFERFKAISIERVKKLKDYAFVHFKERDDALHAMNMLNGSELDGSIIEVTLAKPVDRNQYFRFTRGVSPSTIATNIPFALPNGGLTPATAFDFRTIPYLTIPATNAATLIPVAMNPFQPKNIRRCVNATGRLPMNGTATPTGILTSSSRPSQPSPNVAHHRGPYYTILRPSPRRSDMPFVPTAFGFHPGTQLFHPAAVLPHPYLTGHHTGAQTFHPQSLLLTATTTSTDNGATATYLPAHHPQANFAFPLLIAPSLAATPTDNGEPSVFSYSTGMHPGTTPSTTSPTTDTTTSSYSA